MSILTATGPPLRLNEVRPGRPEQYERLDEMYAKAIVSMKSGLEDRNNGLEPVYMRPSPESQ